jgi:glutathione S-transferase
MKLYTTPLSNFGNKSVIVIYEKGVDVEIVPPPGDDLKSAAYLAINPLGKIPALEADGQVIAESEVINEYLEDKFPNPPLLPKDPEGRARVRGFTRHHDLYVDPPMRALFFQMDPKTRNADVVKQSLASVESALDYLESRLGSPWATGASFSLADCALAPSIWYVGRIAPAFGAGDPLAKRPKLKAWFERVQQRPSVKRALEAQAKALAEMMSGNR